MQIITLSFPQVSNVFLLFNIPCAGDVRYYFLLKRSDKKYYGAILSPATNFLLSFPYSLLIFSQFSPNLLLFSFLYVLFLLLTLFSRYSSLQGALSIYERSE